MNVYYYIFLIICVVVLIIVLSKYTEKYTMSLGNYGHQEPGFCNQETPDIRFKDLYVCNACDLACSTKNSWDKCQKCQEALNYKLPGVL